MGTRNENLGALIDLTQIKDGSKLEKMLKDFNSLERDVDYKIKIAFEKKFEDLSKKYDILHNILQGDLDDLENLDSGYKSALADLTKNISDLESVIKESYVKKGEIKLEDLDESLKEILYKGLDEDEGTMIDSKGNIRKVRWTLYFTTYNSTVVYLDDIKNKSVTNDKTISAEDWLGSSYNEQGYIDGDVEVWVYNNSADSYLSLNEAGYIKVADDAEFDSSMLYYIKSDDNYLVYSTSSSTWDSDKTLPLYCFDNTIYEDALISKLEDDNSLSKSYVLKNIKTMDSEGNNVYKVESPTIEGYTEPPCGSVIYTANRGKFEFDNALPTRYVFKVVKYVD